MIWRRHPLAAILIVVTLHATHDVLSDRVTLATPDTTSPEGAAAAAGVTRRRDADFAVVVVAAVDGRGRRHGRRAALGQASNLKRFGRFQEVLQSVFGDLLGPIQ